MLRRSSLRNGRVHSFPNSLERWWIAGKIWECRFPLLTNHTSLVVWEPGRQIDCEPIVFALRLEGGSHVGKVDGNRLSFEQLVEVVVVTSGPALIERPELF